MKDQKNVMVELDVLPGACDANWRSTTPCFSCFVNVMLLPTMSVMDWEDVFLLFAMEPQLEGSEECDGGAGCTSCACDANWEISPSWVLIVNVMLHQLY